MIFPWQIGQINQNLTIYRTNKAELLCETNLLAQEKWHTKLKLFFLLGTIIPMARSLHIIISLVLDQKAYYTILTISLKSEPKGTDAIIKQQNKKRRVPILIHLLSPTFSQNSSVCQHQHPTFWATSMLTTGVEERGGFFYCIFRKYTRITHQPGSSAKDWPFIFNLRYFLFQFFWWPQTNIQAGLWGCTLRHAKHCFCSSCELHPSPKFT